MYRLVYINCGDSHLLKCFSPPELSISKGDTCVVEKEKVKEFGHVETIAEKSGEPNASVKKLPIVLRRATLQDQSGASENILFSRPALRLCQEKINEHQLNMKLIRVHYSFDRSRLRVDFTANERIDFRQLVQALAAETHARIEMRQISVRDEASIVSGLAPCGRELCCSLWLNQTDTQDIHIRMAKMQGLSLNPASVNGMCGRLKCCLRFENNCYRDLAQGLPHIGTRVKCPDGSGKVLETHVLSQQVKVLMDDKRVREFDACDVKRLGSS